MTLLCSRAQLPTHTVLPEVIAKPVSLQDGRAMLGCQAKGMSVFGYIK